MDPLHGVCSRFLRLERIGRSVPVLVAVSGGADSLALLSILVGIGQRVGVAHVHHGLRGDAADSDLERVAARARELGLRFHGARVDAAARDGRSPEARARVLRYAALDSIAREHGYEAVATAHTLDDQAETLLLRAIRGTGPGGLASIVPSGLLPHSNRDRASGSPENGSPEEGEGRVRLLRPLLDARRAQLRAYLRDRALAWCEDRSNRDPRVPRSRLRERVLPELEAMHPGAVRKLAELASAARETETWLQGEVERALEFASQPGGGGQWLDPDALLKLPRPLLVRALAHVLARVGLRDAVTRIHLERAIRFLEQGSGATRLSLPGGQLMLRSGRRFWIGPEPGPGASS